MTTTEPATIPEATTPSPAVPLARYQRRKDRFGLRDVLVEALLGLSGRVSRLLLLVAATSLGVGSLVATVGFGQTGGQQIAARLDATVSTQASVVVATGLDAALMPWDADERVGRLNGVVSAGLIAEVDIGRRRISAAPLTDPTQAPGTRPSVLATSWGLLQTVAGSVVQGSYFNTFHQQTTQRVAVLGAHAARNLRVTRVDNQPTIFIGEVPYVVIGIVEGMQRRQELIDAVIIPQTTARRDFGLASAGDLQVRILPGAGDVLAQQAPTALNPGDPTLFVVTAPPATSEFRENLLGDIDLVFLIIGAVVLLVAGLTIAVVSSMSVMERRGEIGLRRALGATRPQVSLQFIVENTVIGFIGGLLGAAAGMAAVLTSSSMNQWRPVLDLKVSLLGLAVGTVVGLLAGLAPAAKAARLEPATALQEGT